MAGKADREQTGFAAFSAAWRNRSAARGAWRAPVATGFVSQPDPRSLGMQVRGRQLVSGHFMMAGRLFEAAGKPLWDLASDPPFQDEAQGFAWLDDLGALGDAAARRRAQDWTWDWIARARRGRGPGWTPDLAGRRVIRWVHHALLLLHGQDKDRSDAFFAALSAHVHFLSKRWPAAAPGLPRFSALTGLLYASLALTGMADRAAPAIEALAAECGAEIDKQGGIATRNPEELLEVFTLLTWTVQALGEAGRAVPEALSSAVARIAPCLRTLRHADGGLARFHGGGRGVEGRLDHALSASGIGPAPPGTVAMGFLRLSSGRTSVIVDAADPPGGRAGRLAHASTLAFELTSGRRPLIVSCGSGVSFGAEWRQAGRATLSHSTLTLEGYSSSRMGKGNDAALTERAHVVMARPLTQEDGKGYFMAHDGWSRTHGLTHSRQITLSPDGRMVRGQDALAASTPDERRILEAVLSRRGSEGLRYSLRFHLHPDVDAEVDLGGTAVSLALKSGEVWVFRPADARGMVLEPSVYLERGRLKPRPCQQIVINARVTGLDALIGWTLAKAQDTPLAIRDLAGAEDPILV